MRPEHHSAAPGDAALRDLLTAAGLWTWDADLVADTTVYQEGFWESYGYPTQPTETFDMIKSMHRSDSAQVTRAYRAHLDGETDIYESEWRLRTADGGWRWIRARGKVTARSAEGSPLRMAGVYMDITEGRLAEALLAEAEAEMSAVYLGAQDGIVVIGMDYRLRRINGVGRLLLEELFGESVQEGADIRTLPRISTAGEVRADIERILAGQSFAVERALPHEGRERHLELSYSPVRNPAGAVIGAAIAFRDITERKRLEAARLQAMRLESMGLLASGVAHDFNNLLTAIMGNVDLAEMNVTDEETRGSLDEARTAARRAAELVQQLLAFAGEHEPTMRPLDVSTLTHELVRYARKMPNAGAMFVESLAPNLPQVEGDATQLRQVILNLLVNAIDATCNEGQSIAVRTALVSDVYGAIPNPVMAPRAASRYVLIEVTDDGCGMDQATQDRIFEPFFTTKPTGHGLGLASVLGALRSHGGTIGVKSTLDAGTTFTIALPASGA